MNANSKFQQRLQMAAFGLALAGMTGSSLAQTTNNPNSFDTSSGTTSEVIWWGTPSGMTVTWDSTRDAANNAGSGSALYQQAFTGASGEQFMTFSTFANRWQWDDGVTLDGSKYTNLVFDIKVAPGTAPSIYNDYGPLEVGLVVKGYAVGDLITLTTYIIPPSATNWTHVVVPINQTAPKLDQVVGTFFKMWSNGRFTNSLAFNLDNVWLEPNAAPPPPPPTLSLGKTVKGLNLISSSPGQYDRQSIYTLNPGYSWVNTNTTTSVTYSVTIKDYPANTFPNYQTHIFLATGIPYGPGDSAVDWNSTNLIFIQIQNNTNGGGNASFMYKTNVTSPTDRWSGQIFGSNTLATIGNPTIKGKWSLTFTANTNVTLTTPSGSSTNFIMPPESVALFDDPQMYIWFGAQANTTANVGQTVVLERAEIKGGVPTEIDDSFSTAPLDTSTWGKAGSSAAGIQVVDDSTPFWVFWTLPDTGFGLESTPLLKPLTWANPGLTALNLGTRRGALVPTSVSTTNSAYFRLVKRVFVRLQVLLPGETAAPDTASGKTGTPTAQPANTPFDVTVNAVDERFHVIASGTDMIHLTSSDTGASLPSDAALVGGTATFSVTMSASGTITASDVTNAAKTPDTSSSVTITP